MRRLRDCRGARCDSVTPPMKLVGRGLEHEKCVAVVIAHLALIVAQAAAIAALDRSSRGQAGSHGTRCARLSVRSSAQAAIVAHERRRSHVGPRP